jgi:O-antigen ligase
VATRLSDLPLVQTLVAEHPWFGTGGGTYLPANAFDVLDNQYYKTAVEMGLIGGLGVLALFVVPVLTALGARARSRDPLLRQLAGALAGAGLAGAVSAATFDALSFGMTAGLLALVAGLSGACWVLSGREPRAASPADHDPTRGE